MKESLFMVRDFNQSECIIIMSYQIWSFDKNQLLPAVSVTKLNVSYHHNVVKQELNFHDKDTQFYRFLDSEIGLNHLTNEKDALNHTANENLYLKHTTNEKDQSDEELQEGLSLLLQMGPDALLTMILRKWWVPFYYSVFLNQVCFTLEVKGTMNLYSILSYLNPSYSKS